MGVDSALCFITWNVSSTVLFYYLFFLSLSNKSKYIALLDQNIRGKKFVWAVSHLLRNKEPEKKGSFVITMIIFSLG